MTVRVVIIGGPGNGRVAADVLQAMKRSGTEIDLVGYLNDRVPVGELIAGVPVLEKPNGWFNLDDDICFVQAILSVGNMRARLDRLQELAIPQERFTNLIHPFSNVSESAVIGRGCVICAFVSVQADVHIGNHCFLRAGANIGHNVQIGDGVDIGPNSTLCGYAQLDSGVHIAPNGVVRDRLKVGAFSTLSAGSVALKDIPDASTWIGNPARRVI